MVTYFLIGGPLDGEIFMIESDWNVISVPRVGGKPTTEIEHHENMKWNGHPLRADTQYHKYVREEVIRSDGYRQMRYAGISLYHEKTEE